MLQSLSPLSFQNKLFSHIPPYKPLTYTCNVKLSTTYLHSLRHGGSECVTQALEISSVHLQGTHCLISSFILLPFSTPHTTCDWLRVWLRGNYWLKTSLVFSTSYLRFTNKQKPLFKCPAKATRPKKEIQVSKGKMMPHIESCVSVQETSLSPYP